MKSLTTSWPALGKVAAEYHVLLPRRRLSIVEWAPERMVLDAKTSAIPGRWSWEIVPFAVEIAEALVDPGVRVVVLKKCSQGAGTSIANCYIGRTADEAPVPLMIVMPTEETVRRRVRVRLRPMFEACPTLLRHLGGDLDRLNVGEETTLDYMILYLAWATSAIALADSPVCIVILDEVDKYPSRLPREGDPISLAEKRQRTFPFAKTFELSTPTDDHGRIAVDYNRGDKREWWARCPHCRKSHVLEWYNVRLDRNADGALLKAADYAAGDHARYVCPTCGVEWSDGDRWAAVQAGRWAPAGCSVGDDGELIGVEPVNPIRSYHVSSLMLYPAFLDLAELAGRWAFASRQMKMGDPGPMIDFFNSELGLEWVETVTETDRDLLRDRVEGYAAGTVPEGVRFLTAGVDVQLDHFYITVWGWGWGMETWLIAAMRIGTTIDGDGATANMDFAPLQEVLLRSWPRVDAAGDAKGEPLGLALTFIDYQFRSDQVADFCANFAAGDCWPIRGVDTESDKLLRASKLDAAKPTVRRRILRRAGLQLWLVSSLLGKNRLARLQQTSTVGPGYMHLPADVPAGFLDQMSSEHVVRQPVGRGWKVYWKLKPDATANHYWDCSYYALAAAVLRGAAKGRQGPGDKPSRPARRITKMDRFK